MTVPNLCSRRRLLGSISCSLLLAGCTASPSREVDPPSGTSDRTTTESTTDDSTADATTRACHSDSSETIDRSFRSLGEWATVELDGTTTWRIAVTDIELSDSFTVENSEETYGMSEGRRLAVVTTKITNKSDSLDSWEHGHIFVVLLADGSVVKPKLYLEHQELSEPVHIRNVEAVTNARQYQAQGYAVDAGETEVLQWVAVIPAGISANSLRIGFDPDGSDSTAYPLRWRLSPDC